MFCNAGRNTGIAINVTSREFYTSFASIFRLSDGSSVKPPPQERMESVRYMQVLTYSDLCSIGWHVLIVC